MGIGYAEYENPDMAGMVKTVVVAHYYPGGNVQGVFRDNVQRPIINMNKESTLSKALRTFHKKRFQQQNNFISY